MCMSVVFFAQLKANGKPFVCSILGEMLANGRYGL